MLNERLDRILVSLYTEMVFHFGGIHRCFMDVLDPNGIAKSVRDTVAELMVRSAPILVGYLVEQLVKNGSLSKDQLQEIVPPYYRVRE